MTQRLVAHLQAGAAVWRLTAAGAARLRDAAPAGWEVDILDAPAVSDGDGGAAADGSVLRAVAVADAYAGFGMSRPLFLAAPRLRWVHTAAAGVGTLLFREMMASDVTITNSAGIHAIPISEQVLAGLLFLLRGLDIAREQQRAARWDRLPFVGPDTPMREAGECRALILGAGGIGSAIAVRLSALGARCTGVRRHPERGTPNGFERLVGTGEWPALLADTDLLIVSAPATAETRQMVTAAVLDRLPAGAIVVNVARGSLVDEAALAVRVREGRLRGAVLDVFLHEPLDAASPLWGLSSVVLTPHVSSISPRRYWERELDLLIDNWQRFARGEPLRNVVDKTLGY